MTKPPLYILAGGRSSRFGSDKARAELAGVPLILRVRRTLAAVADPIIAVADTPGKYADLGLETIADDRPHLGPVAGLLTALTDCHGRLGPGWIILAPCDLAVVNPRWIDTLVAATHSHPAALALCFRNDRPQPLPGLYHTDLLEPARRRIESGDLSLIGLLQDSTAAVAMIPTPPDWPDAPSVNRPQDLDAFAPTDPYHARHRKPDD